jgi:hypothetical protein
LTNRETVSTARIAASMVNEFRIALLLMSAFSALVPACGRAFKQGGPSDRDVARAVAPGASTPRFRTLPPTHVGSRPVNAKDIPVPAWTPRGVRKG